MGHEKDTIVPDYITNAQIDTITHTNRQTTIQIREFLKAPKKSIM